MRAYAKQIGWSLSDRGLRPRNDDGTKLGPYVNADCPDERAIFRKLGLQWRYPWERDPSGDQHNIRKAHQRLKAEHSLRIQAGAMAILPEHLTGLGFNA